MAAAGHPNQKLVLGPWGHTDTATRMLGNRDFGAQAVVDLQRECAGSLPARARATDPRRAARKSSSGATPARRGDLPAAADAVRKYLASGEGGTSRGWPPHDRAPPCCETRHRADPGDQPDHATKSAEEKGSQDRGARPRRRGASRDGDRRRGILMCRGAEAPLTIGAPSPRCCTLRRPGATPTGS
jgi:predicted acyl esterase